MQKLFDAVSARLKAFVGQRDDVALVVCCRDEETPVVLKSLEGIDDASTSEMFWIASDEFRDAPSYADAVVDTFAAKHGAVRLGMEQQGMAPWPPLPPGVLDQARTPVDRLRELMIFSRALLPAPDGMLAAWCLVPLAIADRAAYAALLGQLLRHEFPNPWCHHLRIYVRGDTPDPTLRAALAPLPRIAWYEPELGQAAVQRALDEEVEDAALPLERRLQNLLMSAGVDHGYERFGLALQKYAVLLKYYAGTRNETMTAIVLNAVGETHARMGNDEQASRCFELAFAPAAQAAGPPIPVLLTVVLNLGNLRLKQERWVEGEAYYDAVQQLATLQRDANTKLRAIENLGHCQYMQGKVKEALASWHAGAAVAGELEIPELRRGMLERLAAHYRTANDDVRVAEVRRQLAEPLAATAVTGS